MIPLDLYGEVTTASGARFKWDANQAAGSRPQNFSFRTKIGEGFSDASLQLARRIDQDYPDLNLVDNVVFTGADGSVAYEGRNSAMPRDLGDRHSIGVTLAGWMAHAKDRRFAMPFVDRPVSRWDQFPIERRAQLAVAGISTGDFQFSQDGGGVVCAFPNQALGALTVAETWYEAPPGTLLAGISYRGSTTSLPVGYAINVAATDVRSAGTADNYSPTMDDTTRVITFTTPRRYALLQVYSSGVAATPAAGAQVRFTKLAAYGDHALAGYTGDPSEPIGVYLTDALTYIARTYCPMLDTSGIQQNPYVVQHLAFNDRTYPYDAFLELNKYALWHLGVWENKRLDFRPYDLSDYDWEIRTDDPGTTFSPQGPSTESLFNGMEVTYTNPLTGAVEVITPDTDATVADTSLTNPWNAWGLDHWDPITLSSPELPESAANLGAAALADRNRPKTPGTITVTGYIRDRAGNPQPAWKPRAGQTISITNFPNDLPRLIVETDYNDEDKTIKLAIDSPFALLDAYLDRQTNALQAAGLS